MKQLGFNGFRWGIRPDIGVVFQNGKKLAIEVVSHSQTKSEMMLKMQRFALKNKLVYGQKTFNPYFLPIKFKKP